MSLVACAACPAPATPLQGIISRGLLCRQAKSFLNDEAGPATFTKMPVKTVDLRKPKKHWPDGFVFFVGTALVVERYKSLADIERGFWVRKPEIEIGPVEYVQYSRGHGLQNRCVGYSEFETRCKFAELSSLRIRRSRDRDCSPM